MSFQPSDLEEPHEELEVIAGWIPVSDSFAGPDIIRLYWHEKTNTFWTWDNWSGAWDDFGDFARWETAAAVWRARHLPDFSSRTWVHGDELGENEPDWEFTNIFEWIESLYCYVRSVAVVDCGVIESAYSDCHLLRVGPRYLLGTTDYLEGAKFLGNFESDSAAREHHANKVRSEQE